MPVFNSVFYEVTALLLLAAGCGAIALLLRQPLIVAFIAVGILAGPAGLNWVHSSDQVDLLTKLGIVLLLFIVGLKVDVALIRRMGRVALATGLGQVLFTSATGFGMMRDSGCVRSDDCEGSPIKPLVPELVFRAPQLIVETRPLEIETRLNAMKDL